MFNSSKTVAKLLAMIMVVSMLVLGFAACGGETTTDAALTSIEVVAQPTNTKFEVGSTFDYTGAKVKVTFDDGTTQEIAVTSGMIGYYDFSTTGQKDVTVTYTVNGVSKSTTIAVAVVDTIGGIRTDAADAIVNYDKAQAVKNDTVIVALTEAYVSSVNQAATQKEADELVKAYKAAVDAYVGAQSKPSTSIEDVLAEIEKNNEILTEAIKKNEEAANKAEAAALLVALRVSQTKALETLYETYAAVKADYQLAKNGSATKLYIDNFADITAAYEKGDEAIANGATADEVNAAYATAAAEMDAVLTVKELVYKTVVDASEFELIAGIEYKADPYTYEEGWDEVVVLVDDNGTADMIANLTELFDHIDAADATEEKALKKYVTEGMFPNAYGKNTISLTKLAETVVKNYKNLMAAVGSAEAKAYYAAVEALLKDGNVDKAKVVINAPALDFVKTTDKKTVPTVVGSTELVEALVDAREAFIEAHFEDDEENVNINNILNSYVTEGTALRDWTDDDEDNKVSVSDDKDYVTGYVAAEAAIYEAWNNMVAAVNDQAVKDIILSAALLGSTTVKWDGSKVDVAKDNANAAHLVVTTGYLLYTDAEAVAELEAAIEAYQEKYGLTDDQVNVILANTVVPYTAEYTHKNKADNADVTEALTLAATIDKIAGVNTAYANAVEYKAGNVLKTVANVIDEVEDRVDDYTLLSTKKFDGMIIADAIADFNATHAPVTIVAVEDRDALEIAVEKWAVAVDYDAAEDGEILIPGAADKANYAVMLKSFEDIRTEVADVEAAKVLADKAVALIIAADKAIAELYKLDLGTLEATAFADASAAVKAAYDAHAAFVATFEGKKATIDPANVELLAEYDAKGNIVNNDDNIDHDHVYFENMLEAATDNLIAAYILNIGKLAVVDGNVYVKTYNTVAAAGATSYTNDDVKTARKAYDAWVKATTKTALVKNVVIGDDKVAVDLVAILTAAEAYVVRTNLELMLANAATSTNVDVLIDALEAYAAWLAKGNSATDAEGVTEFYPELNAIMATLGAAVKAEIDAIGDVVYAVNEYAPVPTVHADDKGDELASAREHYDAYAAALKAYPSYTYVKDNALKTETVTNLVENLVVLERGEARYAAARALAISLNHYFANLPASVEELYKETDTALLAKYKTVLTNIQTLYAQYVDVNQDDAAEFTSYPAEDSTQEGYYKVTEDYVVTYNYGTYASKQAFVLTADYEKIAVGSYLPVGTKLLSSVTIHLWALDYDYTSKYLVFDAVDTAIASVEFNAARIEAAKEVNALAAKYTAEAISSSDILEIDSARVTALAAIGEARQVQSVELAKALEALTKAVDTAEKAMKAALN